MDKNEVVYSKEIEGDNIKVHTKYSLINNQNKPEYQLQAFAKSNGENEFKPFMNRKMSFLRLEEFIELSKQIFSQVVSLLKRFTKRLKK